MTLGFERVAIPAALITVLIGLVLGTILRSVRRGLLLELGGLSVVFALMETLRLLPT